MFQNSYNTFWNKFRGVVYIRDARQQITPSLHSLANNKNWVVLLPFIWWLTLHSICYVQVFDCTKSWMSTFRNQKIQSLAFKWQVLLISISLNLKQFLRGELKQSATGRNHTLFPVDSKHQFWFEVYCDNYLYEPHV